MPLAIVVAILLTIVVISYRQTIYAYPSGGGSYVVSRENLGEMPSLVAGASLLTDYILTVAVSIAGGVLAIQSAFGFDSSVAGAALPRADRGHDGRQPARAEGVGRPVRPADVPLRRHADAPDRRPGCTGSSSRTSGRSRSTRCREEAQRAGRRQTEALAFLMLLRAFSSGAVALSGVEAVSNGVPAFRKPESRNASMTIAIMGAILGTCFLGVSILASHLQPYRGEEDPTGIALMAEYVYGGKNLLFWVTQLATFAILILAANTAYADFPRLSSIIARDGYLPRQLANRGDRLVFSNGIIFLAVLAGVLIVAFKGNISALIPLYAFGVFTGFTLSQAGMVVHHFRLREPRLAGLGGDQRRGLRGDGHRRAGRRGLQVHRGGVDPGRRDPGARDRLPRHQPPLRRRPGRACASRPTTARRAAPTSWSCSSGPSTAASSTPCSTPARWRPSG